MRRGPSQAPAASVSLRLLRAGILTPAPKLVVSAPKPVASPLLSLPLPSSSHTERNALSSPLFASRYAVLSVKGAISTPASPVYLLLLPGPGQISLPLRRLPWSHLNRNRLFFCVSIAFDTYLYVQHSSHFLQPFTLSLPPEGQLHKDSEPGHSSMCLRHSA